MEVSNTSKNYIKDLAEFIALEHEEIITPLDKIVDSENLFVFYDDYGKSFDGITIYDDNRFYIHINTERGNDIDSTRGRFTLAHELGHYFIDSHRIGLMNGLLKPHPSFNDKQKYNRIEREADYFSSCLLMPEKRYSKDCVGRKFEFAIIENLAKKYRVSLTASAIRFSDIGNHPIQIIFSVNNEIAWKWASKDFPYKYLAEGNSKIPEDSLAASYFKTGRGEKRTEDLSVGDWFKCYKYEDEERNIYEHIIPFRNMALSVIWED
ncbi:ImmA/IrrE family metallo-endopeptidase [Lutimonas halocynthiae]|uniref:ImmA/IrrE family metallo-endopeptidase n=1 Tax=Lutimonas halocynthiae TaxID=1446477 RepID=UPI0025B4E8CC|nr:ImmA/IrrE family metallo-endopeptidase [Lutimonas halocynthiae]MDN3643614.1 ImmA/IrrE family metallo-endopeptidase [Lutimonas halocynthiae]